MKNMLKGPQSLNLHPECVAGTRDSLHEPGSNSDENHGVTFFRAVEWTADGTTLIVTSSDNTIHTFIVPPDLLEDREDALSLNAYSKIVSKEPVNAVTSFPIFDLQNSSTALVLSSVRDHPIRLNSAFTQQLVASYPLINPQTEAFITPSSLLFRNDGAQFIAGSDSLISIFDASRPGQEAATSLRTGSKKKNSLVSPGMEMKGIISALAIDEHSGILAAGTFTRNIGLYDSGGMGECVGVFTVQGNEADERIGGKGITQVAWSPCGRYLYIVERKSDGVMIYDIRQTGQLVAWLEGRKAITNQRLELDLNSVGNGSEVWAGGFDGVVRMWKNPQTHEGPVSADFELTAHDDVVASTMLHPGGGVLATVAGQRHSKSGINQKEFAKEDIEAVADLDLKIWSLLRQET